MIRTAKTPAQNTALLAALITAQWFSASAAGFVSAAGNAVWLGVLLAGLTLALLSFFLSKWLPQKDCVTLCSETSALRCFPLLSALLFLLLCASSLRDTLTMLSLSVLPDTPRWFSLLLVLPVVLAMGLHGTTAVSRAVRLLAPLLAAVFVLVLVLSVWDQFNVYNFFPLLGTGAAGIGKTALHAFCACVWLPILRLDRPQGRHSGVRACLWATLLGTMGYVFFALLFPNGSVTDSSFPLHRLSLSGGLSYAFQRAQALFVFAWLPVQLAAVGTALGYAVRSLTAVLRIRRTFLPTLLFLAAAVFLGYRETSAAPAWQTYLLQTNTQVLLLPFLLIPMIVGKIKEHKREKEAHRHA